MEKVSRSRSPSPHMMVGNHAPTLSTDHVSSMPIRISPEVAVLDNLRVREKSELLATLWRRDQSIASMQVLTTESSTLLNPQHLIVSINAGLDH
jgi:hypothetical protein